MERTAGHIVFIHLSVYEYLKQRRESINEHAGGHISLPKHIEQATIAKTSLNYLTLTVPALPLASKLHEPSEIEAISAKFAFLDRAACKWMWHTSQALSGDVIPEDSSVNQLLSTMERLFDSRESLLVWFEAMCRYEYEISSLEIASVLTWLASHPQYHGLKDRIMAFESDMNTLQQSFDYLLQCQPTIHEIWTGMTDFLSPQSQLNETPGNLVTCLPTEPWTLYEENIMVVKKTSRVSLDSSTLGLATIWQCS